MTINARAFISAYRWPIFILGLLGMSFTAQGILVVVATRPDTPPPIADYYERALAWDADSAVLAASRRLGWRVEIDVPAGKQFAVASRRPVDIVIHDRENQPVSGLRGRLIAIRPADTRLNGASDLFELPHEPGRYRTLARLSAPGLWEMSIDGHLGDTHFVHTARIDLAEEASE